MNHVDLCLLGNLSFCYLITEVMIFYNCLALYFCKASSRVQGVAVLTYRQLLVLWCFRRKQRRHDQFDWCDLFSKNGVHPMSSFLAGGNYQDPGRLAIRIVPLNPDT